MSRPPTPDAAYVSRWIQEILSRPDTLPEKIGMAALTAALAEGVRAYDPLFFFIILFWAADMLLGVMRAAADPRVTWQWSKGIDGILRLLVIVVIGTVVAAAEGMIYMATGVEVQGKLLGFTYAVIAIQELASITRNAAYFYPRLRTLHAKLIEFFPGHPESARVRDATVVVTRESEDEA